MIITKTPYRLSLFGGGTDYPAWFEFNPSRIISAAMQQYCFITVKNIPPFFDHKTIVSYSEIEKVKSIDEIKHPSARECLRYMGVENVSVVYEGDLPARSGIGSSSAFTVGLLHALYAYKGISISEFDLADESINLEQNILNENVGIQDQIMAAHGGVRIVQMGPGKKWKLGKTYISANYLEELESHIMEMELRAMVALAADAIDSMSREDDMNKLGKLFDLGWQIKRKLAEGVSRDWIDNIYQQSISCGSLGGKLMGAGGGGFFMFLVPPSKQEDFKKQMSSIKVWVPFKFDMNGSKVIHSS